MAVVTPTTQPGTTESAIAAGNLAYSQLPGYNQSISNIGNNIASETAGQLPEDVANQIATAAAERGVATGSPGSPNSTASYLDTLGLNSLALTNMGQSNLASAEQMVPGGAISQNPAFYLTPQQQFGENLSNEQFQYEQQLQQMGLSAAQAGTRAGLATGGGGLTTGPFSGLNLGVGGTAAENSFLAPEPTAPMVAVGPGYTSPAATTPTSLYAGLPMNNMTGGGADTPDAGVEQDPVAAILQDYGPTVSGAETPGGEEEVAAGYGYDPFATYGGGDFGGGGD